MGQFIQLSLYRLGVFLICVSQTHNRNSCAEVQIFLPLAVPESYSFSVVKHHREAIVCFIQNLFSPIDHFFISHGNTSHPLLNYRWQFRYPYL